MRVFLIFVLLSLISQYSAAQLMFSFSPASGGGTNFHIKGEGHLPGNLGQVLDFHNLEGGNPFANALQDEFFSFTPLPFANSFIDGIKLDSDTGGDDFFVYFQGSVNAGSPFLIDEVLHLDALDYSLLNKGVYTDPSDSESTLLGGVVWTIADNFNVSGNIPEPSSLLLLSLGFFGIWLRRVSTNTPLSSLSD